MAAAGTLALAGCLGRRFRRRPENRREFGRTGRYRVADGDTMFTPFDTDGRLRPKRVVVGTRALGKPVAFDLEDLRSAGSPTVTVDDLML